MVRDTAGIACAAACGGVGRRAPGVPIDAADEGRQARNRSPHARPRGDPQGSRGQALPSDPDRTVRGHGDRFGARRNGRAAPAVARPHAHAARIALRQARADRHPRHQGLDVLRQADRAHERRGSGDRRAPVRRHRARAAHASADLRQRQDRARRDRARQERRARRPHSSSRSSSKSSSPPTSWTRLRAKCAKPLAPPAQNCAMFVASNRVAGPSV